MREGSILGPFTPYFTPYSSSTSSQGYCNICYTGYNLSDNKPLLICNQNHCICLTCLKAIRSSPRCPFCRQTLNLRRIRPNRDAIEVISYKQKNRADNRKKFINVMQNERLVTDHTADEVEFVEISELVESEPTIIDAISRESSLLKILIFIELFILQFPFGLYPFFTGLSEVQGSCFDKNLQNIEISLRDVYLLQGYIECLTGILTIYFILFYRIQLLQYEGLICFYVFLLAISLIKNIICECIYHEMMRENYFGGCSRQVQNYVLMDMATNAFQLILGTYLIIKFYHQIRDQE